MSCYSTSTKDATTADCVHGQRTTTVCPAHLDRDLSAMSLPLGPIEGLVAPMIPIAISFVYPYAGEPSEAAAFMSVKGLQHAVSHLLCHYPPLSGRLVLLPNGDRMVDRLGSGVSFVEATCDASLRALHEARTNHSSTTSGARYGDVLSMFDLPAGSNALFAPYSPAADRIVKDPLFTLQHTRFACGGVALGVRISHALTDAQGFFLVVQHLMELYGKLQSGDAHPTLEKPPQWRSYLSAFRTEATPADVADALAYQPAALYVAPEAPLPHDEKEKSVEVEETTTAAAAAAAAVAPDVVGRELYFSAAQLEELKRRATPPSGEGWVSTFEALNAFLWQSVYRARCVVAGVEASSSSPPTAAAVAAGALQWPVTDFLTSVNVRGCFVETADEAAAYFPVGCLAPVTTVAPAVLRDGPAHVLATAVHTMLRAPALSPTAVQRTARWIAAQPDRTRIRGHFTLGGFMISAWNKFDLYGATACDGVRPVLVSTPFTSISLIDALGYILPYPPAFTAAEASSVAAGAGSETTQRAGGVIVYLAVEAALWDTLGAENLFGDHLH